MRVICLDRPTYLPSDIRLKIESAAEFEIFHDVPDFDTALRRLSTCDLAIVEWTRLTGELLYRVKRLTHVALVTSAFDFVDLAAAARVGITVSYCPSYAAQSVAEHVFALVLALARRVRTADIAFRDGHRHHYEPFLGVQLRGSTLGLIGTGRTALATARIATGFGMNVVGCNSSGRAAAGITPVSLDRLLAESDVVSVHVPWNASTENLLDADRLRLMKPTAFLINIGRSQIIEQCALADMLTSGRLAGAGLDDLADPGSREFYQMPNVILTPGIAWYTDEARQANMAELWENLQAFFVGVPRNLLTPPA